MEKCSSQITHRLAKNHLITKLNHPVKVYIKDITAPKYYNLVKESRTVICFNVWSKKSRSFQIKTPYDQIFTENPSWYVWEKMLYFTGGYHYDSNTTQGIAWKFAMKTWEVEDIGPMRRRRARHACIYLNDVLYVFGGDNNRPMAFCERYDFNDPRWVKSAPLTAPREWIFAAEVRDKIYIAGYSASSIECYDPSNDTMTQLTVRFTAENATLISAGKFLYTITLNGLVRYNQDEEMKPKWISKTPRFKWWAMNCVKIRNKAYFIMGGNNYLWEFNCKTRALKHISTLTE